MYCFANYVIMAAVLRRNSVRGAIMFKKLPLCIVFLLLFGCGVFVSESQPGVPTTYYTESVAAYVQKANATQNGNQKAYYYIQAAGRALLDGETAAAKNYLAMADGRVLSPRQKDEKAILAAKIANNEGNNVAVLNNLAQINQPENLQPELARAYYQLASQAHQKAGETVAYCQDLIHLGAVLPSNQAIAARQSTLFCLGSLTDSTLASMASQSNNNEVLGWIAIAQLNKIGDANGNFQESYARWAQQYPNHPANILFTAQTNSSTATEHATVTANVDASHIALLLPTTGSASGAGLAVRDGFMAAYYNHPSGHSVKLYDTNGIDISSVYNRALDEGATLVVGPLTKSEVSRLADAGVSVPTLALNNIATKNAKRNFYQFALSPNDEAEQAAERAYAQGATSALVIAPSDAWGQGIVNTFAAQFARLGGQVRESVSYTNSTSLDSMVKTALQAKTPNAKNNDKNTPNRRSDINVIFLVATPDKARAIKPLLNFYYADTLPVYAISVIYTGVNEPFKNQDLNGIQFCTLPWYVSHSSSVSLAKANASTLTSSTTGLYAFGYDAYNMAINFNQLANGLSGVTGELYLKPNQQVYRQGVWAQFRNGEASLI